METVHFSHYLLSLVGCIIFVTFFSSSVNSWGDDRTKYILQGRRNYFKCRTPCCFIFTFCCGREHCHQPCLSLKVHSACSTFVQQKKCHIHITLEFFTKYLMIIIATSKQRWFWPVNILRYPERFTVLKNWHSNDF